MATWYMFLKQEGEGCDYTIACGETLRTLRARNEEEAMAEAKEVLEFYGSRDFKVAFLIEGQKIGLMPVMREMKEEKEKSAREYEIAKKRTQLEKLKRELGET